MKYATQHEARVFFERARNHIKYVLGYEAVVNGEVTIQSEAERIANEYDRTLYESKGERQYS